MTHQTTDRPSTPRLIGDAVRQATELFATEVALVRLEAAEKLTLVLGSLVSLVVAAVLMIAALIFLLQGLVAFLVHLGFQAFQASFMVGGVLAALALIAIIVTSRNLSAAKLKPNRTLGQVDAARSIAKGRAS